MTLLRYCLAGLRYPEMRELGFLRMGLGIEARAHRFRTEWSDHLTRCKEIQEEWLARMPSRSERGDHLPLMVIGAGRLYDFHQPLFGSNFAAQIFVDADPLSRAEWRRYAREHDVSLSQVILEVTGSLLPLSRWWKERCQSGSFAEVLEALVRYPEHAEEFTGESPLRVLIRDRRPAMILSLNTLSQIPVMWQDIVHRELVRRFGATFVEEHEQDWVTAIVPSARALVRRHLDDLLDSEARSVLVITDLEYLSLPDEDSGARAPLSEEPPVRWVRGADDDGAWELTESVGSPGRGGDGSRSFHDRCRRLDALYDIPLANEKLRTIIARGRTHDCLGEWSWALCPRSDDGTKTRTFHRVGAFHFTFPMRET